MAAGFEISNEKGNIRISKNVLNDIVLQSIEGFCGQIILSTPKGKPVRHDVSSAGNAVIYDISEEAFYIRIYILIRFGAGIKKTTKKLIENIQECAEITLGRKPDKISVLVRGIVSKRITKRDIEINENS